MNLKVLKGILNTYSDSELEDMDMWVNSKEQASYILIDEDNINLITKNTEVKIDGFIEQEGRKNNENNNI